jgi:hypothetical protein
MYCPPCVNDPPLLSTAPSPSHGKKKNIPPGITFTLFLPCPSLQTCSPSLSSLSSNPSHSPPLFLQTLQTGLHGIQPSRHGLDLFVYLAADARKLAAQAIQKVVDHGRQFRRAAAANGSVLGLLLSRAARSPSQRARQPPRPRSKERKKKGGGSYLPPLLHLWGWHSPRGSSSSLLSLSLSLSLSL